MNRLISKWLAGAGALTVSVAAAAQMLPAPQDVLSLSASAAVEVPYDLIAMTLSATREGSDASAVQAQLRQAIDEAWMRWQLPPQWVARARQWCADIKIVVTGGFNPKKIRRFEELGVPVDIYGVGSALFSNSDEEGTNNDFTADIVRVRLGDTWHDLVKVGRRACDNPDLQKI